MSFKEALISERRKSAQKSPCTVCTLIASLPEPDRDALTDALADRFTPGTAISRALAAEGLARIQGQTIQRHRRTCNEPG